MSHPIHSKNADIGCRWLCLSAGNRSAKDNVEIEKAIEVLPFRGHPASVNFDMLSRVK